MIKRSIVLVIAFKHLVCISSPSVQLLLILPDDYQTSHTYIAETTVVSVTFIDTQTFRHMTFRKISLYASQQIKIETYCAMQTTLPGGSCKGG